MTSLVYDVVCIGAGAAGAAAAMTASAAGARVALLSKEPVGGGNTKIARGAMCVPGLVAGDTGESLLQDMLQCGEGMNDPRIVAHMVANAAEAAAFMENLGLVFPRDRDGRISPSVLARRGGHRFARTMEAPSRGPSWSQALRAGVAASAVDVFEDVLAYKLVKSDGRVSGALAFDLRKGEVLRLGAKTVILATGGAGWLYHPHTDNDRTVTGDGYALAFDIGAEMVNMEFIQIVTLEGGHTHPEARLLDRNGRVVLQGLRTLTRAQITAALAGAMAAGALTDVGALILDSADGKGSLVPVWPRVHTFLGGIRVDEKGRSSVPGLYAAGETAGGLQGADRLGSSALTGCLVQGITAGKWAAAERHRPTPPQPDIATGLERSGNGNAHAAGLTVDLQRVAWKNLGLARSSASCRKALEAIGRIEAEAANISVGPTAGYSAGVAEALELQFMATSARLVAHASLARAETRGSHLRTDFPDRDERLGHYNFVLTKEGDDVKVSAEAVGAMVWE